MRSNCSTVLASWNNSGFQCLFLIGCLISCIFDNHCSICVLKVAGVALYRFWRKKLRIKVSSTSVQDLNRAAPATFRTQIEQIWTHFEQLQIRFRTKCKIWPLSLSLRHLNVCFKLKKDFKNFKYQASHVLPKTFKDNYFQAILIWWHCPFKPLSALSTYCNPPFSGTVVPIVPLLPPSLPGTQTHQLAKLTHLLLSLAAELIIYQVGCLKAHPLS